ncbi:MAG: hypothetical protein KBA66_09185 [Leptospiraceae bacterium]|nr:hypothetical protein [Leptospiraceae bacterium]
MFFKKIISVFILFAISPSFLFLPLELKSCSGSSQRIGPILKKGKILGMKLYGFHRDNILRYIGFIKNDIILEVNGFKIYELIGEDNLNQFRFLKENFKKDKHLKVQFLRKESIYELEFTFNEKNFSKIEDSPCSGYEIDPNIPKKEMFDFYEMRKIE